MPRRHGFRFDRLYSFGLALEASQLADYHKAVSRRTLAAGATLEVTLDPHQHLANGNGQVALQDSESAAAASEVPSPTELAPRAAKLYERYINPVLLAIGGKQRLRQDFHPRRGQLPVGRTRAIATSISWPVSARPISGTTIRGSSKN